MAGGLFLVWKATNEIHHAVDPTTSRHEDKAARPRGFIAAIGQILVLDLVFSVDSIITAVGMTEHLPIMIVSVLAAVLAMLLAADPLAGFISRNPTIVMLALGFLLLIGATLIAEGFGFHFPKAISTRRWRFPAWSKGLTCWRASSRRRRHERGGRAAGPRIADVLMPVALDTRLLLRRAGGPRAGRRRFRRGAAWRAAGRWRRLGGLRAAPEAAEQSQSHSRQSSTRRR